MRAEMSKEQRDHAAARVGRALFGDLFVDQLTNTDWAIAKKTPAEGLPKDPKAAAQVAKARQRLLLMDHQTSEVFAWLSSHEINCSPRDFDQGTFETFFRAHFPDEQSTTDKRKAVVAECLNQGNNPGRGGNIGWDSFCDLVRKKSSQTIDDKTVKRDVETLRGK
jgi:hypothetical protein